MSSGAHRVAIVVDPESAPGLEFLSRERNVWAVRSPTNERVAGHIWEKATTRSNRA